MIKEKEQIEVPEYFDDVFRILIACQVMNNKLADIQGTAIWKQRIKQEIMRTERVLNQHINTTLSGSEYSQLEAFNKAVLHVDEALNSIKPQIKLEK